MCQRSGKHRRLQIHMAQTIEACDVNVTVTSPLVEGGLIRVPLGRKATPPLWQDNGLITGHRLREQDGRLFQGSGEKPLTSDRSSFQLLSLGLFNITAKRLMSIWYSNIDHPLKIRHPHSMVPNMSFIPYIHHEKGKGLYHGSHG